MTIMLAMSEAAFIKQPVYGAGPMSVMLRSIQERLALDMGNYFANLTAAEVEAIGRGANDWRAPQICQRCKLLKTAIDRSTGY